MVRPRFSIALLSEDKSEQSWHALKAILHRLLNRFEDDGFTPRIEILPSDPKVRSVVVANRWRSSSVKDEADKRELWRYLARKIAEPGGFVVFHYDGDGRWSERHASQARAQFDRELRLRVQQVLAGSSKLSGGDIGRRMERLIECVPFYSLEAWTYQATERAIALCYAHYHGADADKFTSWGRDRTALDEVDKPKDATCLRDAHNAELGAHVPVREVVEAGCSLAWFVGSLHGCRDLKEALAP